MTYPIRIEIALSVQRALIGAITSNIRCIYVEYINLNIVLTFVFDGIVSIDDIDNANVVSTEIIADFIRPDMNCDAFCKSLDFPAKILLPDGCILVFRRKEEL